MELEIIIKSILGLVVILAILISLLLYKPSTKKKQVVKQQPAIKKKVEKTDLNTLKNRLKNKNNTTKDLADILNLIIQNHIKIPPKKGYKQSPKFNTYMDIIFTICRHKNTTKDLILNFDKNLEKANPEYKIEINKALTKGLNLRF